MMAIDPCFLLLSFLPWASLPSQICPSSEPLIPRSLLPMIPQHQCPGQKPCSPFQPASSLPANPVRCALKRELRPAHDPLCSPLPHQGPSCPSFLAQCLQPPSPSPLPPRIVVHLCLQLPSGFPLPGPLPLLGPSPCGFSITSSSVLHRTLTHRKHRPASQKSLPLDLIMTSAPRISSNAESLESPDPLAGGTPHPSSHFASKEVSTSIWVTLRSSAPGGQRPCLPCLPGWNRSPP